MKKLVKCRNCRTSKIDKLFSLGRLSYTGKFPKKRKINIKKAELGLVKCSKCNLVQLNTNFNLNYLYGPDYGYRTGINKTMREHMKKIQKKMSKKAKLKKGDYVLDIASNDATLLNLYNRNILKFGIDPLVNKYAKYYNKINYKVSDFFSAKKVKSKTSRKFKIITALSVFYDVNDPNKFLQDVYSILDDNGILLLEHADLLSIIKLKMFDTICHEHLYYYSTENIINMTSNNNLKVFDLKKNNINGGSTQYFICKKKANFIVNYNVINKILYEEKKNKLKEKKTFIKFFNEINIIKSKLLKKLNLIISKNKIIHGYGASTNGNVLLQYFGIDSKYLNYIADRNPKKFNNYTPGTKIKIISEKKSRSLFPDFYFVLPWHFKKEILLREKRIRTAGCKFIFPLPKLTIY